MVVAMDVDGSAAGPSSSSLMHKQSTASSVPLHRVRFVDWQPSAVSAMAMVPLPSHGHGNANGKRSVLAIGRENGNIDLCSWVEDDAVKTGATSSSTASTTPIVAKGWVVDTTLIGSSPSKVESIAFVLSPTQPYSTPRLFSTSGGAIVTEHFLPPHLLTLQHVRTQELPASIRKASTLTSTSRNLSSQGGSIWSMAASPLGKHLAIGCEDGVVRIVDIEDGRFELLSFSRSARRAGDGTSTGTVNSLDRAKTRIVSLAWGPPRRKAPKTSSASKTQSDSDSDDDDDDDDEWEHSFIVGGTTQSSALIWSLQTGRITNKLLVDRVRREQSIVWSVATLPDGTCVLGDSLGHVSFFDAKTYTLLQGAKFAAHGRNADVLALCVGSDGRSVYSGSVDQKVVEYALLGSGKTAKWVSTGKRRLHAHDVRAITIDPPYNPRTAASEQATRLPILVTGGVDFHLVLTPASSPSSISSLSAPKVVRAESGGGAKANVQSRKVTAHDYVNPISSTAVTTFADTIHRRIPFVPSTGRGSAIGGGSVVRVCQDRRWLVLRREKSVAIWKLPADADAEQDVATGEGWLKVLEIQAKTKSNLVAVEVSDSGRWLLLSDLFETKLFELIGDDDDDVVPKRVRSFSAAFQGHQGLNHCPGASAACFSPDGGRVIVASQPGSYLHVVELPQGGTTACKLLKSFGEHRQATSNRAIAGKMAHTAAKHGDNGKTANGKRTKRDTSLTSDSDDEEEADEDEVDSGVSVDRNSYSRIDLIAVSPDGQYVVSVDTTKRIHCYSLDTLHHHGVMPSPAQQPNAIAFNAWQPSTLCCVLPTNQVVLYDLDTRRLLDGSRKTSAADADDDDGTALIRSLNEKLSTVRDSAVGAFWLSQKVIIVWGASFMCTGRHITREKKVKGDGDESVTKQTTKTKGKRSLGADEQAAVMNDDVRRWSYWRSWLLTKYQPLLFVGTVRGRSQVDQAQQEMVVVERPYYDVSRNLPPTWFGGASYGS